LKVRQDAYMLLCATDAAFYTKTHDEINVYQLKKSQFAFFEILDEFGLQSRQKSKLKALKEMVEDFYCQNGLYFSLQKDLSALCLPPQNRKDNTLYRELFFINNFMKSQITLDNNVAEDFDEFPLLNIMQGYIFSKTLFISNVELNLYFIFRRFNANNGRRFFNRGIDNMGHTANFVEVEIIMSRKNGPTGDNLYSKVFTRGSIPLFFTQMPFLLGLEKIKVNRTSAENVKTAQKHIEMLLAEYGEYVYLLSLIDTGKKEGALCKAYSEAMSKIMSENDNIGFYNFEFHKETSGMRYYRINIALDKVNDHYEHIGSNKATNGEKLKSQNGVIRVNCIDSLDRTGVIVSALIRKTLKDWLVEEFILKPGEDWSDAFEFWLRNEFANASDMISLQYSGQGALKTEYTRTGKRTNQGKVDDFVNSAKRKILSLTTDAQTEDTYRIVLGKHNIENTLRLNALFYPFTANLTTLNKAYFGTIFTLLFSGVRLLRTMIFKSSRSKTNFIIYGILLMSSVFILRHFNNRLIIKPRLPITNEPLTRFLSPSASQTEQKTVTSMEL